MRPIFVWGSSVSVCVCVQEDRIYGRRFRGTKCNRNFVKFHGARAKAPQNTEINNAQFSGNGRVAGGAARSATCASSLRLRSSRGFLERQLRALGAEFEQEAVGRLSPVVLLLLLSLSGGERRRYSVERGGQLERRWQPSGARAAPRQRPHGLPKCTDKLAKFHSGTLGTRRRSSNARAPPE